MVVKATQERVSALIKDTITLLCKNGLEFHTKFTIDATIGVTLDDKDIFLVSMNELINADGAPPPAKTGSIPDTTSEKRKKVTSPEHKAHKRKHSESVTPVKVKTEPEVVEETTDPATDVEQSTFKTEPRGAISRIDIPSGNHGYPGDDTSSQSYMERRDDDTSSQSYTDRRSNEPPVKAQRSSSPEIEDDDDSGDIVFVKQEGSDTPRSSCSYQPPSFMGFPGDPGGSPSFNMSQMNYSQGDMSQEDSAMWTHPGSMAGRMATVTSGGDMSQLGSPGEGGMHAGEGGMHAGQGTGDKSCYCRLCNKYFSTRQTYQRHERQHAGKYSYYCPYCNKGYNAKNILQGHLSWHTGVKEFKCQICAKEFRYKHHLKEHMSDIHRQQI